ncbi:hypothetical protein AMECASPLE_032633, partial [Ameca splendens]
DLNADSGSETDRTNASQGLHKEVKKGINKTYSRITSCLRINASGQSNQAPSWTIIWCHRSGFKGKRLSCPAETNKSVCVCLTKETRCSSKDSVKVSVILSLD